MHAKLKSYLKTKILGFIRSIELEQRNKWGPARLAITTAPGDMDALTAEAVRCLALPPPHISSHTRHSLGATRCSFQWHSGDRGRRPRLRVRWACRQRGVATLAMRCATTAPVHRNSCVAPAESCGQTH